MTTYYRLKFFNEAGYAGLETDEGMNLMVPVAWLPADVAAGSKLTVTLAREPLALTIRIEVAAESPKAEEAAGHS